MKIVSTCGAVVFIKFDKHSEFVTEISDIKHPNYSRYPENLTNILRDLNEKYDVLIPFSFRNNLAVKSVEIMGVLTTYSDTLSLLLEVMPLLETFHYHTFISFGFGEVLFEPEEAMTPEDRLHELAGNAVYASSKVYKDATLNRHHNAYFFYAYHFDLRDYNLSLSHIIKKRTQLAATLEELQTIDRQAARGVLPSESPAEDDEWEDEDFDIPEEDDF